MLFQFEQDFVDSLRCIPMAIRLRLDVCGIKLKLNEWSKFTLADRQSLVEAPFISVMDHIAFGNRLRLLTQERCGAQPAALTPVVNAAWDDVTTVPAEVTDKARSSSVTITSAIWANLSQPQRFSLCKLSRPGHENKNFIPACREFGLADEP